MDVRGALLGAAIWAGHDRIADRRFVDVATTHVAAVCPSKPYEFIGFGARDVTKPYKFIWFGDIHGPKPNKFIGMWQQLTV